MQALLSGSGPNSTTGCSTHQNHPDRLLGKGQEQIFASRYRMELPTEAELAAEVRREMKALGVGEEAEVASLLVSKRNRNVVRSDGRSSPIA